MPNVTDCSIDLSNEGFVNTDCPIVNTKNGKVKGRVCVGLKRTNARIYTYNYQGIPFAQPPVGELRFEPPQPMGQWDGIYEATKTMPMPAQDKEWLEQVDKYLPVMNEFFEDFNETSEDCLYLNIYTNNPTFMANQPVLVFVHGGGWLMGGSSSYPASVITSLQDVVVVVLSYRVNALGFFSMGQGTKYPGNNGLLDQVMGLQWVKDNIRNFGGDPENITLMGESSGSISVGYHMLSPLSKGLFQKAVSSSGTANFPALAMSNPAGARDALLTALKIHDEDIDVAMKKLKAVPFQRIMRASREMWKKMLFFGPVVDGVFLPAKPDTLIEEGHMAAIPYIIGFNNSEGNCVLSDGLPVGMKSGITKDVLKEFLKIILATRLTEMEIDQAEILRKNAAGQPPMPASLASLGNQQAPTPVPPKPTRPLLLTSSFLPFPLGAKCQLIKSDKLNNVIEAVINEYQKGISIDDKCIWSTIAGNVIRDVWFANTSIEIARAHSAAGNDTYMYYFTHTYPYNHLDGFNQGNVELKPRFCQADHTDDITLTFGFPLTSTNFTREVSFTENDELLSECWIKYLANFCKTGDPNKDGKSGRRVAEPWVPYNEEEGDFLKVRYPFESAKHMFEDRVHFWKETVPALYRRRIHSRKMHAKLFKG